AGRARRGGAPLDRAVGRAFFRRSAPGLVLLVLVYLLVTILRSVRADFAPEIWRGLLRSPAPPAVFATSEAVVAAGVLLLTGSMVLIRDNRRAFFPRLGLATGGGGGAGGGGGRPPGGGPPPAGVRGLRPRRAV